MKTLAVALILCLAACVPLQSAGPAPGVRLTAARVSPGVVGLTLENGSTGAVGYNLCTSALQRRSGTTWTPVATDDVCIMQLSSLQPGKSATFDKRLPAGLDAGEYRYIASVEAPMGSAQVQVATDPFRVP